MTFTDDPSHFEKELLPDVQLLTFVARRMNGRFDSDPDQAQIFSKRTLAAFVPFLQEVESFGDLMQTSGPLDELSDEAQRWLNEMQRETDLLKANLIAVLRAAEKTADG